MERWKYTPVNYKRPILLNWVDKPMSFDDAFNYTGANGVGVLCGEQSGGLLCLDFDGTEAWETIDAIRGDNKLEIGLAWGSGKPDRMQAAFFVPAEFWGWCRTFKAGPTKKLEFRWNGSQSVVPPSQHPETGAYDWVNIDAIPEIPMWLLEYWVDKANPVAQPVDNTEYAQIDNGELVRLLNVIRESGRLNYDDWIRVSWATCHTLNGDKVETESVLRSIWHEENRNEYKRLLAAFSMDRSPKIATLIAMAKNINGDKTRKILRGDDAIAYIRKALNANRKNK